MKPIPTLTGKAANRFNKMADKNLKEAELWQKFLAECTHNVPNNHINRSIHEPAYIQKVSKSPKEVFEFFVKEFGL